MNNIEYINKQFDNWELAGYTSPGWYFWDETQSGCYGPYESEEIAIKNLEDYCHQL